MDSLVTDELTLETVEEEQLIRVDWKGRSNAREPWSQLCAFFESLAESAAGGQRAVRMHFENIEYFNSSTITAVIRIIQLLQMKQVPLTLVYDPKLRWQKLSFDGLRIFEQSNSLLKVEEATG